MRPSCLFCIIVPRRAAQCHVISGFQKNINAQPKVLPLGEDLGGTAKPSALLWRDKPLDPLRFNGLYTPSWLPRLSGESNVASNSDIGFPFGRLPSVQSLSPLSAIAIAFYARQPAKPSVLLLK